MQHVNAKQYNPLPFVPVFLGGAPRSGTTLLNAYVCSAPETNDLAGEGAYLLHLMPALAKMRAEPELTSYFKDIAEFEQYHANLLRIVLTDMWHHFGRPKVLVLKSPFLTPYLPEIQKLIPEAKSLVLLRDIRDVIASRCRVEIKIRKSDAKVDTMTLESIHPFCEEYLQLYMPVLLAKNLPNLKLVQYERFVSGALDAEISAFLGITPSPEKLWKSEHVDIASWQGNEWNSEAYGKSRTSDTVGSYKKYLSDKQIQHIERTVKGTPLAVNS